MDIPDFIEVYPDMLSAQACAALVARFEAGTTEPGRTGAGVNLDYKKSDDITISGKPEWTDAEHELNRAMFAGLLRYLRKYPQVLLSSFALTWRDDPDGPLRAPTAADLAGTNDATLSQLVFDLLRPGTINLQRYRAETGGYPAWHCELGVSDPRAEYLHRVLLWTIYLNDDFEDGETEFQFQQRKIRPRTGSLLFAPTAFTHTHRGNRAIGGDKYIATSWVLFKRHEHFPPPAA
jgi:hypothetical protein